ncbi:hypothetical protein JKP75_00335 [Blastococcus sp. TML/M2B]|uniref:hypothetical protein n=1 Tax=unclassified Blastococcus TaxID=2619396 RepID=UPI00190B5960|nr:MULTISPECIES: hypothetical protein [unclassified Blastococcus]MBN1091178.1 hypothetical protein [Blastococcus sp. TML/M2B]MBN1095267.1 hypothetical protein [Blastococcus sp. TML/C7B]
MHARDLLSRRRPPVALRFGPSVDVSAGDVRVATDALMGAIQQLSGQEYLPGYAPRRAA